MHHVVSVQISDPYGRYLVNLFEFFNTTAENDGFDQFIPDTITSAKSFFNLYSCCS